MRGLWPFLIFEIIVTGKNRLADPPTLNLVFSQLGSHWANVLVWTLWKTPGLKICGGAVGDNIEEFEGQFEAMGIPTIENIEVFRSSGK